MKQFTAYKKKFNEAPSNYSSLKVEALSRKYTLMFSKLKEGKKQAFAILPDKAIIDELIKIDPTPTGKYLELFTKLIKREHVTVDELSALKNDISVAENKKIVIDVGRIKTLGELKDALQGRIEKTKGVASKGTISGVTEGKDYLYFGEFETKNGKYQGYIPLTWEGSKAIAHSRVSGCEGKWCIAYEGGPEHWNLYATKNKNIFIYGVSNDKTLGDDQKISVQFDSNGNIMKIWDAKDNDHSAKEYFDK